MVQAALVRFLFQKIPWGIWALIVPTVLQATVLRKRGNFAYRNFVSVMIILATGLYCFIGVLLLKLFGRGDKGHYYACIFHSTLVRTFLGINGIVEGKEHLRSNQPAIYVLNHQTFIDLHFMSFEVPEVKTTVIAKKAIKYYPFLGWFLTSIDAIFLDRTNRGDAVKQARQVAKSMKRLNTGIYVFPEGTRGGVENVDLLPFKKGAFHMAIQAKVPIIPVVIANYKCIYNPKKKFYGYGTIKIRVLPPIPTDEIAEDSESVSKLAEDVREQMLTALKEITVLPEDEKKIK